MTLIEPDVALTDFGLAAECALFAGWLQWRTLRDSPLRGWFVVLCRARHRRASRRHHAGKAPIGYGHLNLIVET